MLFPDRAAAGKFAGRALEWGSEAVLVRSTFITLKKQFGC